MTSLMDIVSIIVVYLLKSYASDPVVINPTAGQKIPLSTADAPMQDGIPIFITLRGITFDNKKVVGMTGDGDIDPASVSNHLIGPLYDALAEEVDKAKQMAENSGKPWAARAILVGDQDLKFSALVDVMYTAGRADAIAEYARAAEDRNAKWDNASCTLDIFAAADADRDALSELQEAFYEVTKDRNRREDCHRIDIDAMRRLADWAVKNQEPELVAPGA